MPGACIPIRKERSIELEFPPAHNAQDLVANFQRILAAVGEGRITPGEAQTLTEVLSTQAHLFKIAGIERRAQQFEAFGSKAAAAYRHQQEMEMRAINARFDTEDLDDENRETA